MPRRAAAVEPPRYRRPSRRRLTKTLRTLKALLPPPEPSNAPEDVADFLERLVASCLVATNSMQNGDAVAIDTSDLPPSPPPSPLSDDADDGADTDTEAEADEEARQQQQQLESLSCFSAEAVADLAEQVYSLGPVL